MMMSEIRRGMSSVSVGGTLTDKSEVRRVRTRYGIRSVCDATLEDETGNIKLSLWEDMIDIVNVGDKVRIMGAYVTEFSGQLQLNIPRSGKLEVIKGNVLEI